MFCGSRNWPPIAGRSRSSARLRRSSIGALRAPNGEELSRLLAQGIEKIKYSVDRESQSVLSVLRLVAGNGESSAHQILRRLVQDLENYGGVQIGRLHDGRGPEGGSDRSHPASRAPRLDADPQLDEAAHIVVKRKRFGTIPLDEIHPDEREGYPSGAWDATVIAALYWCDGQRESGGRHPSHASRARLAGSKFDFVAYFKFLERRGYVELKIVIR